MTTHSEALARTLSSDPILRSDEHAATVKLAEDLAAELDQQIAETGHGQTRTIATLAGILGNFRRILRDERAARAKQSTSAKSGSRLAAIKRQTQNLAHPEEAA